MTLNDKNKEKTDKAWLQLYNRIERDGLLDEKKSIPLFRRSGFRRIAAIAIICIVTTFAISRYISREDIQPLLTLHNNNTENTLVTTLNDGSVVYLNGDTKLSYPENFEKEKREVYLQGDAFFDVRKDPDKPFIIETESVLVEVLGTSFNVKSKNNLSFSLSVLQGEVKVTLKETGQVSYVKAGQTTTLNNHNLQTRSTSNSRFFSEYTNRIHFKDEPLRNIVKVMNLQSDSLFLQVDTLAGNRLLTFTFTGESIPEIAQLICSALELKYEENDDFIRISEKK